jgi:TatD DNase family protein
MIDTHCHLYAEQFDDDRDEVVKNAISGGVSKFLLPNIDLESLEPLYALSNKYPDHCLPMMGLHPTSVDGDYKQVLDRIYKELGTRKFVAIGEIGLDYYWDTTFKEQQIDAFKTQMLWASELNLPVAIHTRNSFDDAFACVEKIKPDGLTGVFHCFSGSLDDAQKIMNIDFFMGIGGVLTFKNGGIDKVLPDLKIESLVLETDAPYLAPVPHRGKRNSPEFLPLVAFKMAEVMKTDVETVHLKTTENAIRLFKLKISA